MNFKYLIQIAVVFVGLSLLSVLISCSGQNSAKEFVKFELRLAQSNPDSNLTEMIFNNSDERFFIHDSVYLTNSDIMAAEVIDRKTRPKVQVALNEEGREKFSYFTGKYVGWHAAMILDGKLISAPRINAQITKGVLLIVGLLDEEDAERIAAGIVV